MAFTNVARGLGVYRSLRAATSHSRDLRANKWKISWALPEIKLGIIT